MEQEHKKVADRLHAITSNSKKADANQKAILQKKYDSTRNEWRKRKRMFNEMCGVFEENIEAKKFKKIKKDIGFGTDEDHKQNINEDKTTQFLKTKQ